MVRGIGAVDVAVPSDWVEADGKTREYCEAWKSQATKDLLPLVRCGLRPFFQRLAIPDKSVARVAGQFKILREFERVSWTRIFAQPAEHAAAQVVGKVREFLAAGFFVAFAGDHNQVFRTRQRAQITGDAHRFVGIWVDVQARRASETLGHLRPLQRILLGIDFLRILIAEGDLQPLQQVDQEDFSEQARHAHIAASITLKSHSPNPCLLHGLETVRCTELSPRTTRTLYQEDVMKAYFTNLPMRTWVLLIVPAVVIAYPVVKIVIPAVVHAVVPEVVRTVLSVI